MLVPLQYFILFHPALPRFTPLQYFPTPIRYASRRTNISQAAPRRQISLRPLRGRKIPPGVLYTVHPVNFTPATVLHSAPITPSLYGSFVSVQHWVITSFFCSMLQRSVVRVFPSVNVSFPSSGRLRSSEQTSLLADLIVS